jgi:electron transfer flavoprotein alpha subunit
MPGGIWVIAEEKGGRLARISAEGATLARALADASGGTAAGVVATAAPAAVASELGDYVPRVLSIEVQGASDVAAAAAIAPAIASLVEREQPSFLVLGATPEGRDLAGMLSALLGWGVLANAIAVGWADDGPSVDMSILGGRFLTTSAFTGDHGILTIRSNSVAAEPSPAPGSVEVVTGLAPAALPVVRLTERVDESSEAVPIEEARVIVAGGRGIGSTEGFAVVEDLAHALDGSVGATRAAVDAGWIGFSQQIGQTGKVVKPQLYVALGISGAIQHTVGVQGAETVVAVNKDPDAPIAEFADLFVVGDLFTVGPAIVAELKSRGG